MSSGTTAAPGQNGFSKERVSGYFEEWKSLGMVQAHLREKAEQRFVLALEQLSLTKPDRMSQFFTDLIEVAFENTERTSSKNSLCLCCVVAFLCCPRFLEIDLCVGTWVWVWVWECVGVDQDVKRRKKLFLKSFCTRAFSRKSTMNFPSV